MIRMRDILDDIAWVDDIWTKPTVTWPIKRYKAYDPEKYDLVPKKEFAKELAEAKKKEIESLEKEKENIDKRIKELKSS